MILILLGAPGSGKGTHAKLLSKKLGYNHYSMGDILRKILEQNDNSKLGQSVKASVESGLLVSDEVVVKLIESKITETVHSILDGFPRNIKQANLLDKILNKNAQDLKVMLLKIDERELFTRLTKRVHCPNCKTLYNTELSPPKDYDICDNCSTNLVVRKDDTNEVILRRLQVYHEETEPLIDYYNRKGNLYEINANRTVKAISEDIIKYLSEN